MKLVYGIHKPRYVSDQNVVKFYNKLGLQGAIYRLKDYSKDNYKNYQYIGNSMPDVLLFNSDGQLTRPNIDCSSSFDSLINLGVFDIDQISTSVNSLKKFISDTYSLSSQNTDLSLVKRPIFVVKFGEYAGRLNRENVPRLVKQLSLRKDVHFIILNMDYSITK